MKRAAWLFLAACVAGLYLGSSAVPVIFDETEGQYAGAAKEMLSRGDWLLPTNNGLPRLQKPPLVYWALALSFKIFGVNVFAARLPNAFACLAWIGATALLGRRVDSWRLGAYAALVLATSFGFFIFGHLIMPEPFLGVCITFAFWCLMSAFRDPAREAAWLRGAWVFMTLGTLVKGAHGFLYPAFALGGAALFSEKFAGLWKRFWSWRRMLLFGAAVAPWYLAMEVRFPGFLHENFVNEQVGHLLNTRIPPDSRAVPSLIFWGQHLLYFLPWTLFVPAVVWAWRRPEAHEKPGYEASRLLWAWIAVTAISVAFSARQDYYTMTCWSAVAVALARPWAREEAVPRRYWAAPCVLMTLAGLVGVMLWPHIDAQMADATLEVDPVADRDTLWSALHGSSFGGWSAFVPLMKAAGAVLLLGGAISLWLAGRKRAALTARAVALVMLALLVLAVRGLALKGEYYSLAAAAGAVRRAAEPEAMVVYDGEPHLAASLFFYLDRFAFWVNATPAGEFVVRRFGLGSETYLDRTALRKAWRSSRQVFLLTERAELDAWARDLGFADGSPVMVGESGTRVALANRRARR
ncbi:MAG: glycosyltransferase family 39 protein [Verrucomicrobiae bacterium]|nr:glycosyltransferase family 39 protein [Verrucomicrobiae bacterium]